MTDETPSPEQPALSPSAYMALAMVRDGVDTGYRIKQRLERAAAFFWSASYGQIYPELRRLEAAGLIEGRDVAESGRLRREYGLTEAGEQALRRWLAEPVEPSLWIRDEGLLRMMLVDWDDRDAMLKNLGELRRQTAEQVERLAALTPPRERGRRIRDLGVRMLEERLAWCDELEAELGASA